MSVDGKDIRLHCRVHRNFGLVTLAAVEPPPADLAKALTKIHGIGVAYLASDLARDATGQIIVAAGDSSIASIGRSRAC
jgi:hypothetical protein